MRKRKTRASGWAAELLFVAGIYSALFCLGWLFAGSQLDSGGLRSPSGHGEQASSAADGGDFKSGKLLVFDRGKCQIGQFSNIRPDTFEVVETECDHLSSALVGPVSGKVDRDSRIETIGRYFRGR